MIRSLNIGKNGLLQRSLVARQYPLVSVRSQCVHSARPLTLRLLSTSIPPIDKTDEKSSSDPSPPPRKPKVELRPGPIKSLKPSINTSSPKPTSTPSQNTHTPFSRPSHPDSIVEITKRDIADAAQHGILVPPPPGASWPAKLWHQAKELFKFYWRGLKMINQNRKVTRQILMRARAGGPAPNRWETRFIRTYRQDALKLVPFIIIVLVLEEIVPLIALYAPFMLPSTCVLPSQRERIEKNAAAKQVAYAEALHPVFQEMRREGKALAIEALGEAKYSTAVCRLLRLSTWGGNPVRTYRITNRLRYIAKDDAMLRAEGLGGLSHRELVEALHERGIITRSLSPPDLPARLQRWLDTVDHTYTDAENAHIISRVAAVAEAGAGSK